MRILLYYPWIYLKGGIERVILETVKRSRHSFQIATNYYDSDGTFPDFKNFKILQLNNKVSIKRYYSNVGKAALAIISSKIDVKKYDALLVQCDGIGNLITFKNSAIPCYCYCHTPLRPAYDKFYRLNYLKNNKKSPLIFDVLSAAFRVIDYFAWKKYRIVFCNSQETRSRLLYYFPMFESKVKIINPGVNASREIENIRYGDFFLIAGRITWTKNVELGVDAFIKWKDSRGQKTNFSLVIAGCVDEKSKKYIAILQNKCRGRNDVIFKINPNDREMEDLFRECYSVLFTSFNEDWGIVPLEAGVFKKSTIAVNRGGPLESIIDKKTGFLCDPNAEKFCEIMDYLVLHRDLNIAIGEQAKENVVRYDWSNFIQLLDSSLENNYSLSN